MYICIYVLLSCEFVFFFQSICSLCIFICHLFGFWSRFIYFVGDPSECLIIIQETRRGFEKKEKIKEENSRFR